MQSNPDEAQLPLFPEQYPESQELPEEIQRDLQILTGGLGDALGDPFAMGTVKPESNAQERFQQGLMKKHEMANIISSIKDTEVHVFDLALKEEAEMLAAMYNKVFEVPGTYRWDETPKKMILDHKAPRGFRCLITVTIAKIDKKVNPQVTPPKIEQMGGFPDLPPPPSPPPSDTPTVQIQDGGKMVVINPVQEKLKT